MLWNTSKHPALWETLERNMVILYLAIQLHTCAQAGIVLPVQQTAFANNLCKHNTCFYVPEKAIAPGPPLTVADPRDSAVKLAAPLWPIPQAHIRPLPPWFIMPHQYNLSNHSLLGGQPIKFSGYIQLHFLSAKKKLYPILTVCFCYGNTSTIQN